MAQVMMPTRRQQEVRQGKESGASKGQLIGAALGAVAGGMSSGPSGAIGGASTGASIGSMIGGAVQPGSQARVENPRQSPQPVMASGAVDRRLAEIESTPTFQIQQAQVALKDFSPDVQSQYKPFLDAALQASRKGQKVGVA